MFELVPVKNRKNEVYNPFYDFEKAFFDDGFFGRTGTPQFKCDIKDEGGSYLLEADLPGFEKNDIKVDLEGDYLTINAERHSEHEDKEKRGRYVRVERSYGKYSRSFDISGINADGITAKYENGVLKLTLPKAEETLPKAKRLEIE